ncbi:MAG TPA: methionine--tRNA ligase, partial [Ignavibacteriaceae bacterium]|nr:methionine--tRNA ligase [Ignavibacteriaceae bacterium]
SRTSLPIHHETAKEFFLEFYNRGLFVEKKSLQFYDAKANMFLPDRYVEGTCPKCGNEEARSDECENCGALYDPSELKNPKSKISGGSPTLKETTHYYFPLGKYQPALEKYVDEMNEKYGWKDNVIQYCRGWFKDGLKDRAITRDLDWGIKVPVDSAAGKVIYVWFEAVLGYISSTKEYSQLTNDPELWKKYWHDPYTKYVAFIGKDNVVFHTIIFPAILMAWNDGNKVKYCLPQNVPANEFLNFEGKKFSKSRGWGIDVDEFLDLFEPDLLRYALAANLPETRDTDFYWKEFQLRNNSELADILGNFVNRTFTFVFKHFDGKVPALGKLENIDEDMLKEISEYPQRISEYFEKYKIRDGVNEIMNLARDGNKYFNDSEPWKTIKTNKERCGTTLNICLQAIYTLAELFLPVLPFSSEKLFKMLNTNPVNWKECGKPHLKEIHQLNQAEILFPKIEDEKIEAQINKLQDSDLPQKSEELITYDDFMKVHLRVAEVIEAERVKKSEKLLRLKVKIDNDERQVIAGIAKSYTPETIIGKKVVIVANLKPAKLMGLESKGMILAVETEDGELQVLNVSEKIKTGTRVQ